MFSFLWSALISSRLPIARPRSLLKCHRRRESRKGALQGLPTQLNRPSEKSAFTKALVLVYVFPRLLNKVSKMDQSKAAVSSWTHFWTNALLTASDVRYLPKSKLLTNMTEDIHFQRLRCECINAQCNHIFIIIIIGAFFCGVFFWRSGIPNLERDVAWYLIYQATSTIPAAPAMNDIWRNVQRRDPNKTAAFVFCWRKFIWISILHCFETKVCPGCEIEQPGEHK